MLYPMAGTLTIAGVSLINSQTIKAEAIIINMPLRSSQPSTLP